MHTFFTWGVFIPLFICHSYNDSFTVLFIKIAATGAAAALLYDVPGIFEPIMAPFRGILEFHDPLHPENKPMHEWFFRSGLDHFVWVFGMFCAFAFPWLDKQLQAMEALDAAKRARAPVEERASHVPARRSDVAAPRPAATCRSDGRFPSLLRGHVPL